MQKITVEVEVAEPIDTYMPAAIECRVSIFEKEYFSWESTNGDTMTFYLETPREVSDEELEQHLEEILLELEINYHHVTVTKREELT